MRQFDLENGMLMWCERYDRDVPDDYTICREYYIFAETDTATAERITEKILTGFDFDITGTSVTEDGLAMVTVVIEAQEYEYDADAADTKLKRTVDGILKNSNEIYDYDSNYIEAA